jgi:hypothetical protein
MSAWMDPEQAMAYRPKDEKIEGELTAWDRRLCDLRPLRLDLPIEGDGTTYRAVSEALRVMAAVYERAALATALPPVTRFTQLKGELKAPRMIIRDRLLPSQRPEQYNSKRNGIAR